MLNKILKSKINIIKKLSILSFLAASLLTVSGCSVHKAYKEYMGYDRYEWDDSISYIDEPHKLPCKQVSTKDAPRLCDGTLISTAKKKKNK